MLAKFTKVIIASLISLGTVSAIAVGAVFTNASPANAQVVDGRIAEYNPRTAPVLNVGDRGPVVRDLQLFLRRRGYYFGRIDGIYGSRTAQAVRVAQLDRGVRVDGIVGRNTWAALYNPLLLQGDQPGPFD
ncbi:MAG: peptidoglycan-binding protein [Scytonematopsis contorta HA4267-MV1]|jgi:peptidoglycan hydrolase-like protein with peptidoglycan-binding domain|nr:peptidoglycan-binding protein [Scytonematopsis contorta HA4267-MV1]